MKNDHFFRVCSRLGHVPHVFSQVKEWLTLELHGMITLLHSVACLMDFNLLCDLAQQLGVLKI